MHAAIHRAFPSDLNFPFNRRPFLPPQGSQATYAPGHREKCQYLNYEDGLNALSLMRIYADESRWRM